MEMMDLALPCLEAAMTNYDRIAVEWPRNSGLWETHLGEFHAEI